ncbi:MAG: STAS domain-containing protein [Actinomycetota bacterium]|nr:STAS domain-containing protein [Actinomycetota bacterium]
MDLLSVVLCCTDASTTLRVTGELDVCSAHVLSDAVSRAVQIPGTVLALEMSGVGFIDCAGIGALLDVVSKLERLPVQLLLVNASPCVQAIIFHCGLSHRFDFVIDTAELPVLDLPLPRPASM